MADSSDDDETLIDERKAKMISLFGGKPFWRNAHFLKPSSMSSSKQAQTLCYPHPNSHPSSKPIIPILKSLSSKVIFHGWKKPPKEWNSWIEKLRPSYESIWKKSCIYEAIMASKYEIPRCRQSIFALAEKRCTETNTFMLSWGEVTITLEDITVLGGFSVTGDSVLSEISLKKLLEMEEKLHKARLEIIRSKSKKATQQQWMDMWMGKGRELEHEAFLCLWLSRYVLPADDCSTINKSVLVIAVLLARGTRIALATAVLASIYKDLRLLKEIIVAIRESNGQNDVNVAKLTLWAPLQLLQVWFWERFPKLSPNPNPVTDNLCRLIRWNKVKLLRKFDVGLESLDLDLAGDDFRWRPYSKPLNNWSFDIDLQSYVRCIRVSQLVGLDCVEWYLPHRVAMQFGLDQDIPIACPCLSDTKENAWRNYNRPIGDVKLYMPPKLFEADVTTRYLEWWKISKVVKESSSFGIKKEGNQRISMEMKERLRIKIENNEADVPPGFSPVGKRVAEGADDSSHEHQLSAKRSKLSSPDIPVVDIRSSDIDAPLDSSSATKEMKSKDDFDDDQKTSSQLFAVKDSDRAIRSGSLSMSHQESPSSSAGENTFIQETKSAANYHQHVLPSEKCTRKELNIGIESKAASPISIDKIDVQASFNGAHESSDIDLLDRIARLQRLIDILKAAKIGQTWRQNK